MVVKNRARLVGFVVWAVLLAGFYREFFPDGSMFFIGTYNANITDLLLAVILVPLVFLAARRAPRLDWIGLLVLGFASIVLLGVARGFMVDPFQALFSSRQMIVVYALLVIGIFLRPKTIDIRGMRRAFLTVGMAAAMLSIARAVLGPVLLFGVDLDDPNQVFGGNRAASSGGATLIAVALLFEVARPLHKWRVRHGASVLLLFAALVVAQQATVLLAFFAAAGMLTWLTPGKQKELRLVAGVLIAAIAIPLVTMQNALLEMLPDWLVADTATRQSTLSWRQDIWSQAINSLWASPLASQLFGLPAGVKPTVYLNNAVWTNSLHSQYVSVLSYAGAVGLLCYMLFLSHLAIKSTYTARKKAPMSPVPALSVALCAFVLVFGYTYDIRAEHALMLWLPLLSTFPSLSGRRIARHPIGKNYSGPISRTGFRAAPTDGVRPTAGDGRISPRFGLATGMHLERRGKRACRRHL